MAAYDDVYKEFRKSDEYKALPNTEKEAKEKAANNEKIKNAQGWEEKEIMIQKCPLEILMKWKN